MARYEQWSGRIISDPDLLALEPHEMTKEQFERHPHTFWHASPSGTMGDGVIHFGTQKAAYEALTANLAGGCASHLSWQPGDGLEALRQETSLPHNHWMGGPKDWHGNYGFLAVRVCPSKVGEMLNVHDDLNWPFNNGDMQHSGDGFANETIRPYSKLLVEAGDLDQGGTGYWYRNESEDTGSLSGVVPHKSWLWQHEHFIKHAVEQSYDIPEHVLAEYPHLIRPQLDDMHHEPAPYMQHDSVSSIDR